MPSLRCQARGHEGAHPSAAPPATPLPRTHMHHPPGPSVCSETVFIRVHACMHAAAGLGRNQGVDELRTFMPACMLYTACAVHGVHAASCLHSVPASYYLVRMHFLAFMYAHLPSYLPACLPACLS